MILGTGGHDSNERHREPPLRSRLSAFVAKRSVARARWTFLVSTPLYAAIVLYIDLFKAPLGLVDAVGFVGIASTITALVAFFRSRTSQVDTDS